MMNLSDTERRQGFSIWLRTGRLPTVRSANGLELKFNPSHDPPNGRFTFAPGGVSASSNRQFRLSRSERGTPRIEDRSTGQQTFPVDGTLVPAARQSRPPSRQGSAIGRGNNSRAFDTPMTLEQSFPGLRSSPGGAIIAVADNLFDITGPAIRFQMESLQDQARHLTTLIKDLDPGWNYNGIGATDAFGTPIVTLGGLTTKVNDLRFQHAATRARIRGDYGPLQVETLRFVQRRTNAAYDDGMLKLKAGRLSPKLSEREALGNYIDRKVREDLRDRYNQVGIDSAGKGPVRVNRRENDRSGTDTTYRRPDSRVADVAFDVTLSRKTLGTAQVRGFFNTDFRPSRVVIIRPSQLGPNHTYVITRPETKR